MNFRLGGLFLPGGLLLARFFILLIFSNVRGLLIKTPMSRDFLPSQSCTLS